jgi:hypothetical protein
MKGAGGTPGGLKSFIIGAIMAVTGGYLLLNQVKVHSGFWRFFSYNGFGIALIPFLFGIGLLFFNGKSIPGWILTVAGFLVIIVGIIANLEIYFLPTSLFNTLIMLILLVGGVALLARSLKSVPEEQ